MNPEELLGRAERLVSSGARHVDQLEVYMESGASLEVDLESSQLSGSSTGKSQGGCVRIVKDGRLGFAYFTDLDKGMKAVEQAAQASKLSPRKNYALPSADSVKGSSAWHEEVASLDPNVAIQLAEDLLAGAKESAPDAIVGGGAGLAWGVDAIASSEGAASWDASTQVSAGASLVLDGVSAWDSMARHDAIDAHKVGADVGTTCKELVGPKESETGDMDVLFLPGAVGELVGGIIANAVDGDTAKRGKSVWSDALGESVADSGFHIHDAPRAPGAIGVAATDGEGLASKDLPIIQGGVLQHFQFDSWDAHEHGAQSTHSASRSGFKGLPSTGGQHWVVSHDNAQSMDALLSDMDGYVVESVLGAHTANATTGDFSVTATNVWRVENGEKTASTDVALSGNLPTLLQRLDACSDTPRRGMGSVLPAVRFRDVSVSA